MKNTKKKLLAILSCVCLLIGAISFPANATPTQDDLNDLYDYIDDINYQKDNAEYEINSISEEIVQLMGMVGILEDNLDKKNQEMAVLEEELAAAQKKEQEQNSIMKARIKSIYEKGNTEYLTAFLEARSLADLMSKMEYASTIYDYDKTMLDSLKAAKEKVATLKRDVEREAAEIAGMIRELANQKENLEIQLDVVKASIADFDAQLAEAQQQAAVYRAAIEEENRIIREQQAASGGGNTSGTPTVEYQFSSDGSLGSAIVAEGLKYVGNPYVWGGTSLTNGADCSGFVQTLYGMFGISLPRVTWDQGKCGVSVPYSEARPGDLVYYGGHIGIYMGDGMLLHASYEAPYPDGGIKVSSATFTTILDIRRVC